MKRLLCYLLPLLFIAPEVGIGEEVRPGPAPSEQRRVVKKKKKKRAKRRSYRLRNAKKKKYAAAKKKRASRARRVASKRSPNRAKRVAVKPAKPAVKGRAKSKSTVKSATVAKATPKPKKEQARPRAPLRLGWRGDVRRSLARTPNGSVAAIETFDDMNSFLRSLPDDGEIRVRYGIYPGPTVTEHTARFDKERRNVRVPCWLYGIAVDSAEGDLTPGLRLLIGSSPDSTVATYMYARIPGSHPDLPGYKRDSVTGGVAIDFDTIPTVFAPVPPRHIMIEGALFFNGRRDAGKRYDPGRSRTNPLTVWEIQPVVSIDDIDDGLTGMK